LFSSVTLGIITEPLWHEKTGIREWTRTVKIHIDGMPLL
jgi:hypothetical protein